MTAKTLMVVGSMSSAGKSLLVTALCRIYARRGVRVAPFKAQNMSNNAAVCRDGSEIGRAQFTQAQACRIPATAAMNPVLLKPEADSRSQVVVMGKAQQTLAARDYYRQKAHLWQVVTAALDSLRASYDLVIAEGAGSPVELNLKPNDIVNMAIATYASAPVLLAGDIDRGGIFAQLLGTLDLLDPGERALVKGLLVNKFRGDPALFEDGVRMLEQRGGVPVLGVIPYVHHGVPEEDAVAIEAQNFTAPAATQIDIAVLRLPRIANFDDFDPLAHEPGVRLRYIDRPDELGQPDAIIIPGTKSTMADLDWLRVQGLDSAIQQQAARGCAVVGICGGYQMLGTAVHDPHHVESSRDSAAGLGLLPTETTFAGDKATHQAGGRISSRHAWLADVYNTSIKGYEIHMGRTTSRTHWLQLTRRGLTKTNTPDGAISGDGRVWGCYIHGLFANAALRRAWLRSLGWQATDARPDTSVDAHIDALADVVEAALNMPALDAIIGLG